MLPLLKTFYEQWCCHCLLRFIKNTCCAYAMQTLGFFFCSLWVHLFAQDFLFLKMNAIGLFSLSIFDPQSLVTQPRIDHTNDRLQNYDALLLSVMSLALEETPAVALEAKHRRKIKKAFYEFLYNICFKILKLCSWNRKFALKNLDTTGGWILFLKINNNKLTQIQTLQKKTQLQPKNNTWNVTIRALKSTNFCVSSRDRQRAWSRRYPCFIWNGQRQTKLINKSKAKHHMNNPNRTRYLGKTAQIDDLNSWLALSYRFWSR